MSIIEFAGDKNNNIYTHVRKFDGQVWSSGSVAFETYSSAEWPNYSIPLTEDENSGYYKVDFPTDITEAGEFGIIVYKRLGASFATGDPNVGAGSIHWNGSMKLGFNNVPTGEWLEGQAELDTVPSYPPTRNQMLTWLFERAFNRVMNSGDLDFIYKSDGETVLATGEMLENSNISFIRDIYRS